MSPPTLFTAVLQRIQTLRTIASRGPHDLQLRSFTTSNHAPASAKPRLPSLAEAATERISRSRIRQHTVVELREWLKRCHLSTSGKKDDLCARIQSAIEEVQTKQSPESTEPTPAIQPEQFSTPPTQRPLVHSSPTVEAVQVNPPSKSETSRASSGTTTAGLVQTSLPALPAIEPSANAAGDAGCCTTNPAPINASTSSAPELPSPSAAREGPASATTGMAVLAGLAAWCGFHYYL